MLNRRLLALLIIVIGLGVGFFVYHTQETGSWPFKLGLDLSGGTQLVYQANLNDIQAQDVSGSMSALQETVERRVDLFGVAEPLVQTETSGGQQRLIVELPGVTDTQAAIALIGQTPVLEFRLLKPGATVPTDNSTTSIDAAACVAWRLSSPRSAAARGSSRSPASASARKGEVADRARATNSGVPSATIRPPSPPASGPISITQSAHFRTS